MVCYVFLFRVSSTHLVPNIYSLQPLNSTMTMYVCFDVLSAHEDASWSRNAIPPPASVGFSNSFLCYGLSHHNPRCSAGSVPSRLWVTRRRNSWDPVLWRECRLDPVDLIRMVWGRQNHDMSVWSAVGGLMLDMSLVCSIILRMSWYEHSYHCYHGLIIDMLVLMGHTRITVP